jgi:hypothetical protein
MAIMKRLKSNTFILSLLTSLIILPVSNVACAANPTRVVMDQNVVSVYDDDGVFLRYSYKDVPFKPYVKELFTPGGVNVLLDAPTDHLHHHALMFAVTADGVDFWAEQSAAGGPGRQAHQRFDEVKVEKRGDAHFAGFSQQVDWQNPQTGQLVLKEIRTIEICNLAKPKAVLLTWQSQFEAPDAKESVTLSGSHYQGLGMRFVRSMDLEGEVRNADGKPGVVFRGEERLVRSRWCAYTAKADGKDVTVAMFDHPRNERHPATWFMMNKPFAYLSATLALHEQPLKVESANPLVLRYAAALWDGRIEDAKIEELYKRWAALPQETTAALTPQQAK